MLRWGGRAEPHPFTDPPSPAPKALRLVQVVPSAIGGNLLDSMLSEHRDREAAMRFLWRLLDGQGRKPLRLTTDKHPALHEGDPMDRRSQAPHRTNRHLNDRMAQHHRPIKQSYYPMLGFGRFESASRFCTAFDELRHYLRVQDPRGQRVPASERRRIFSSRFREAPNLQQQMVNADGAVGGLI